MSSTLPFDRVVLKEGAGERVCSVPEFLALPLHQRVRLVLDRQLEFFLGEAPVERSLALKSLRGL